VCPLPSRCSEYSALLPTGRSFGRKTRYWPHKILCGGEIWNRFFVLFIKKGAEFDLEVIFPFNCLVFEWEIFLPISIFIKKTIIWAFKLMICGGLKFFASGRIFRLIWRKTLARSGQHLLFSNVAVRILIFYIILFWLLILFFS
jgi:hypothetical protein